MPAGVASATLGWSTMSDKVQAWVWDLDLQPARKLVLLWLAGRATESGVAFPGEREIRERTGLGERMVRYHLRWLASEHDDKQQPKQPLVVRVERRPFAGHVYNLQTEDGTYAGANIITHNCIQAYGGASIQAYRDGGIEQAQMYDGTEFDELCASIDGQVVSLDEADQLMADEHPNGTRGVAPIVDSAVLLEAASDPTLLLYKAVKAIEQMAEKTQANNAVANQAAKDVEAVKDDQFAQLLTLLTTIVTKEQVAPVVNFNPTIDATSKFEKGALQVNMPEPKRKGPLVIKHPDGRRTEVDRGE